MKRIAFCCLFAALLANGFGQTIHEINEKFDNCGTVVIFSDDLILEITPFIIDMEGIETAMLLYFQDCEGDVVPILENLLAEKPFLDYEKALSGTFGGNKIEILLHHKEDAIDEMILVKKNEVPSFMRIQGNLKKRDVEAYIEKSKNESGAF